MEHIYLFFPMFANGMVALSFLFKLYKRSISSFIMYIAIALTSNIMYAGHIEIGLLVMIIVMIAVMVRAMTKCDADSLFTSKNKRRRADEKKV